MGARFIFMHDYHQLSTVPIGAKAEEEEGGVAYL